MRNGIAVSDVAARLDVRRAYDVVGPCRINDREGCMLLVQGDGFFECFKNLWEDLPLVVELNYYAVFVFQVVLLFFL